MKVKELIKQLRRMDPDAEVGWAAHDQSENELDGWVEGVREGTEELCEIEGYRSIVVLRP